MPKLNKFQTSFTGGLVSPPMWGRIDLGKKYGSSLKECKNFLPRPQGGLMSRTGSTFLFDTELDGAEFVLIEFHPNTEEAYTIEITNLFARAIPSDFVEDPVRNNVTDIGATPWAGSELKDLRWDFKADSVVITHPNYEPREIKFLGKGASPDFSVSTLDFTTHPFQKADKSGIVIRYVDDTNYLKIVSSNATEFNSIVGKEYIEFKFDGQWQLAELASVGGTDTFKDGSNVPAPTGNTAYVIPVVKMVQDFSKATKSVLVQKEYLQDTYPDNSVTENQAVTLQYPDLDPTAETYWWLRADTQVFSDDMVGAWVRFRSDYNKVYSSENYADNEVRWGQILRRVGQEPHTTEFMVGPSFKEILEGHTYRALRAGTGYQLTTNCPIQTPSKLAWDLSFVYKAEGETFQPASVWWFDNTTKGYTTAGTHPSGVTVDYFSANTILEHLDTRISFDVAVLVNLVGPPVGSDVHVNNLLTISGEMTMDDEGTTAGVDIDQLGHLGHIRASRDFFYNPVTNTDGVRAGQYIMAKHDEEYVTYLVDTVTSVTEAQVSVVDGSLPIDVETEELYDEGRTDEYRISAWWSGNWPYTIAFHESRVCFGGSPKFPNHIWISKLVDDLDLRTIENDGRVLDTTGITYPIPGKTFDRVNWMSSGAVLSIGVQNSEWQLRPNQFGAALTPLNIRITEQTENGSHLQPLSVNGILIFPDATNKKVVEYFFDFQQDKHVSRDVTIFANQLFYKDPVVDYCYQSDPFGVIWLVTESGRMVSLTYDRNQEVYAWAEHETLGRWVGVATFRATEDTSGEDRVLAYVERDLPAGTKTYAERMDPLIVQYPDKYWKYGLKTLDCVARVDTGGSTGVPEDPLDPLYPELPYVVAGIPEWVDPWNFQVIDHSLTNYSSSQTSLRLWADHTTVTAPTAPGETLNDYDYFTAHSPAASESPWGHYDDGLSADGGNTSGWKPTTADYICIDLMDTYFLTQWCMKFVSNPNINGGDPPPNHGIYYLQVWTAPESERADGEAFVESNINWTLAETFDLTAGWTGAVNGSHTNIVEEMANTVQCRYVKFLIVDDWSSNGDASNPICILSKIMFELAISNAIQDTINLTIPRDLTEFSNFRFFGKDDWRIEDITGLAGTPIEAEGTNNQSDALTSSYPDAFITSNPLTNTPFIYVMETLDDPKLLCRLIWIGDWLSSTTQPSNMKLWYKSVDDDDWVYHRHFRWPNMNDIATYGPAGEDFMTAQQPLFGGANNANRSFHVPVPQKWYKAFKFEVWCDPTDTGYGTNAWWWSALLYLNKWKIADGEDVTVPAITDDTWRTLGGKWAISTYDYTVKTWTSFTSANSDGFVGVSDGSSRCAHTGDFKSICEGKTVRLMFDVDVMGSGTASIMWQDATGFETSMTPAPATFANEVGVTTSGDEIQVTSTGSKSIDITFGTLTNSFLIPRWVYNVAAQNLEISNFRIQIL